MPKIGAQVGVEGESEFKKALSDINTNLKTLSAETQAVTSAFIGQEKSQEALAKQNEELGKKSDLLSQKLQTQKDRLTELEKAGVDPASKQYQDLQQQIYKTETELNKNEANIQKNTQAMKDMAKANFDKTLEKIGTGCKAAAAAAAAMATAVVGVVGGIVKMTTDAAYAADDLNTMSKVTGISTDELQKMQYAAEQVDVSLDTITGSMKKLTSNMASAQDGSGAASEAFEKLGISVVDSNGALRDRNEVFQETLNALGNIENEVERDALAMDIFGKSAQDLNPLILGGADALKELGDQAEAAGLILSGDQLNTLNLVSDAMDTFKATTQGAGRLFMVQFAEPIADAVNMATGYILELTSAFSEGGVTGLADKLGDVMNDMMEKVIEYIPKIIEFGTNIVSNIILGVSKMLPDIIKTAASVMLTLVDGLSKLIPKLIPVAVEAVITLTESIIDNVDKLIEAALEIILALATGLIDALPRLLEKAPEIVAKLVSAIISMAPKMFEAATQLIASLAQGISNISATIKDIGTNIVMGVWNGIAAKVDWFTSKVTSFFGGIVDGVKGFLGIHSPSRVFAGIGENMAAGLGEGWEKEYASVKKDIERGLNFNTPDIEAKWSTAALSAVPSGADMSELMAGMVNGVQTAMQGVNDMPQSATIVLQLPDGSGTTFARWFLPDLRAVMRDDPELA